MTLSAAERIDMVEACLEGSGPRVSSLTEILAADAYNSLSAFVQQHWHVLEPATPLEWRWYLDLICKELEKVTRGETRDLLICLPPGFMKSLLVGVFWPAWWWLREPHQRFLTTSGVEDLAIRDNRRMREVVESEWFTKIAGVLAERGMVPAWTMSPDENRKRNFENTEKGVRQCYSMTGSVTGHRGNGIGIDDPHQVNDVLGDPDAVMERMDAAWNRVNVVLPTRVNDHRTSWRVTVQQRVHLFDVAGRIKAQGTARCVILPMHAYELDDPDRHPEDPREPGELLDPVRVPEEEAAKLAQKLDEVPGQASAQLEQRPVASTGGLFKKEYTENRYDFDPQRPDTRFPMIAVTVDATFKETKTAAFVSIQAWGIRGVERYLLDEIHRRMDFVDTEDALVGFNAKWRPNVTLIEEKANGAALISRLKKRIQGLVAFLPDKYGDKMTRAQNALPVWAAGNVWLPTNERLATVGEFIAEHRAFPKGATKDRVDAMSQLFQWLEDNQVSGTAALNAMMAGLLGRR